MSKLEWYRRSTWSDADRDDFNSRLKRSRGAGSKAQYLRIQASHLAEANHHAAAIELLDRLLAEFPEKMELALAHSIKAQSLAKLGHTDAATQEYRQALQAERAFPCIQTNAWLDFGWLVVEKQLTNYYEEVTGVLQEFKGAGDSMFPVIEYRYAAIQAILADARGEKAQAREYALRAIAEAEKDQSGLRNHPTLGLVGNERAPFEEWLKVLAGI